MIEITVPFENIGYVNRDSVTFVTCGLKEEVLSWLEDHDESHNRWQWRIRYHPHRIILSFRSASAAMLFKLKWG